MSVITSSKETWEIIGRLVSEWHGVDLKWQVSDYQDPLAELEASIGMALPASFREWYCFLQTMLKTDQWIFRDSYSIQFDEQLQALTLLIQGESDYYWAVKKENLSLPDPPVDGYLLDYDINAFRWDKVCSSRLSWFAVKYILDYHDSFTGVGGYNAWNFDKEKALADFTNVFGTPTQIEDYLLFELPGVLAVITDNQMFSDAATLSVHYKLQPLQLPTPVIHYFHYCYSYSGRSLSPNN
jgi:hypothetical protein